MKGQVIKMNHDEMVARQVLILARQIKRRRNQHLRTVGLTTEQADALTFFTDQPGRTVTAFKTYQEITHQTARMIVQRLQTRGYVQLVVSPTDARAKQVVVTPSGRAKREQLRQHGWQTSAQMFAHLDAEQQQVFLDLLRQVNQNLESDEN
ncbi:MULTISPECIES: MarR family winged helix-turn-helix transcriptional regulator [Lactiplantibacillus]|jgi:DNA-binding MarR family transcriptional regulator|uniref:Transcription regulator n=4 Tax=Lactiplantibacillus plantarum TaxID=1590 RepID=A0AAW3R3N0_LACPN|nr:MULTISPECIES: MarR family winged helix-turn-helix transcriptional regulator [Lactiplantibacillus]EFK29847.1 transcriptional regulator, MarR family [Lactiplantibacillus plantarum subsp. plantarum ATCC 14917 = JCM 1149 = CGMCC 1.2437]ERO42810.1 transcription regulator [Lactiplantibacillus plantarum WJL]KRM00649.1 transcription regulator [Lactiplantibacillus argentoratensis DSM 16365]MBJ7523873.1 winged helix-turn-helix transcriptional regulator [Lactobacillus sp. CRM56-2]PNW63509.1 MarR famil